MASSVSRSSVAAGWPEGHLPPVQAEHAVEARRLPRRGWTRAACGPRRAARRTRASISSALARVHAGERLVEQQHGGVLHERAREQDALALAARQLAEASRRAVGEPHAGERRVAPRRVARAPAAATTASAPSAPISATSSALTGKSSRVRSVCGTYAGRAGAPRRRRAAGELAEQRAEERRLAAAVGPEHADRLARRGGELTPVSAAGRRSRG